VWGGIALIALITVWRHRRNSGRMAKTPNGDARSKDASANNV
jgi:hypothetical protein